MNKLFGVLGRKPTQDTSDVKPKRFSRFVEAAEDTRTTPDADKKFTRFRPKPAATAARPAAPQVSKPDTHAPQAQRSAALTQAINTADQLTSEAQIPVSILRRALPKRFEEMKDDGHRTVFP